MGRNNDLKPYRKEMPGTFYVTRTATKLIKALEASVLYAASITDENSYDGKRSKKMLKDDRHALCEYIRMREYQVRLARWKSREVRKLLPPSYTPFKLK